MTKRNFYIYWWQDLDYRPATDRDGKYEVKFGDTFSKLPIKQAIRRRIKQSLGVAKHKFDNPNRMKILGYLDVSEYARSKGRLRKRARIDDVIRKALPGHVQNDVHQIDDLDEFKKAILKEINAHQIRPTLALRPYQYDDLVTITDAILGPKQCRRILAGFSARYGKTITMLAEGRELEISLSIVACYVLTSFSSFENECLSWKQFKNYVILDGLEETVPNLIAKIKKAIKDNKQVIVFLSMVDGGLRQNRIDALFRIKTQRLVIIDEADYGVHRANQAKPLAKAIRKNDIAILMTGTGAEKAIKYWKIDFTIQRSYQELVDAKYAYVAPINPPCKLRFFRKDANLHNDIVDVEYYQMPLQKCLDYAKKMHPCTFTNQAENASWAKFAQNPAKAKGFFTCMLQGLFLGQHNLHCLNVDLQLGYEPEGRAVMIWLSHGTRIKNLNMTVRMAKDALPSSWDVRVMHGKNMTGREAEKIVREWTKRAKRNERNILIICSILGMRSFSVSEISEIYLAYDEGTMAATLQRLARALTPDPNNPEKIAKVISLSFDPNRDEKFDDMILDSAARMKIRKNIPTMTQAVKQVLRTNAFFLCTDDGPARLEADDYLKQAMDYRGLGRVTAAVAAAHVIKWPQSLLQAFADVQSSSSTKKQATTERGNTFAPGKKKQRSTKASTRKQQSITKRALATLRQMIDNLDKIRAYATKPGDTLETCLNNIEQAPQSDRDWLSTGFLMDYKLVRKALDLLRHDPCTQNLIDLSMEKKS